MRGRSGTVDITKTSESTFGSDKCEQNDMCTVEDDYANRQDVLQLDGDDICTEEDDYAIGQALKLEGYDIGPNEIYISGETAQNFQDIPIENHRIGEMSVLLDGVYVNRTPLENSNSNFNKKSYCISYGKIEWFQSEQTDLEKAYKEYLENKKIK